MDTILDDDKRIEIMHEIVNTLAGESSHEITEDDSADSLFDDDGYKLTLWVKEKDIIRSSGELSLLRKLEPGVYRIDFNRELGLYCQKLTASSDELFVFSESITDSLMQEIDLFWAKQDLYLQNHLVHKRGILLEGFPGTGKTSLVTQLSNKVIEKGGVVFKVSNFRNLDHYVNFLRNNFRKIQPTTPVITILEDIDQYEEVELELLDFLDGKTHIQHHVVIATSNNTEAIPDTFLRPSRLDLIIVVNMPSYQTRLEYFQFKGVDEKTAIELAEHTEDCSLADLKEIYICVFLLDYTIEQALLKVTTPRDKKNYLDSPRTKVKLGL